MRLADEPRGLVLVTGTAGSGKTTTLASMIDHINSTREGHIVTIEDPIEVMHEDKRCIVNQREIGIDTESYAEALRHVVRQDPDVILIGEMRDYDTVSAALTAAEIGNLVFSTLHTIDATETINRIIDFFPPHQQQQVRLMIGATLKGIVSLRLIPSIQGGLVPAVEVLVMTGTVREYIIDPDKTYLIRDAMEEGMYYGMQTFDQSLLRLYQDGKITLDDAISMAHNAHDFKIKVRQLGLDPPTCTRPGSTSRQSPSSSVGLPARRAREQRPAKKAPAAAPTVSSHPVEHVWRAHRDEVLVELVGDAVQRREQDRERDV